MARKIWRVIKISLLGLLGFLLFLIVCALSYRAIRLTEGIDTKTPAGRFFFHIMARLARMERELIVERARAGLAAARKLGRVGGRKRRMTDSKIKAARRLLAGGTPPRNVAEKPQRIRTHFISMAAGVGEILKVARKTTSLSHGSVFASNSKGLPMNLLTVQMK